MKIRVKLALWYFGVTSSILLVFGLGIYFGMQRLLFRALDQELNSLTESIERNYDPFFQNYQDFLFSPKNNVRYLEHYILVYNNNQNVIFASPLAQKIDLNIPLPSSSEKIGYTRSVKPIGGLPLPGVGSQENITFRVISRRIFYRTDPIGWVVAGSPIQRIEDSMGNLLQAVLIAIVAATGIVAVGGYFLTRKTLSPVHKITKKAQQISSTSLSERIEVSNPDDELGQLSLVLNDLLQRLQKIFESQQQFLADAAHELKTPLAMLRTHWENELNNPDVTLELKERLVQDIETITRLNHLINNLILLSQTESIAANFEFTAVRLDDIIEDVISDASILAELKSQTIERGEFEKVVVHGDKTRLYQLFFNVVDNAIKYTPENGTIHINLKTEDDYALMEIRDNGVGIPHEDIPRIFERFFRVQKDRARRTGGSGLGLSICKLIVESHRGSIDVESEMGKGTIFYIRLPREKYHVGEHHA